MPRLLTQRHRQDGKTVRILIGIPSGYFPKSAAIRLRLPDKLQDLMLQAKEYLLVFFDKASGMRLENSDGLFTVSAVGRIAICKLYSNDELHVTSYSRPIIINGISGYANRPDLMERAIPIRLSPIEEGKRKIESEMRVL